MNICLVLYKYGVRLDDPCCYPLGYMYVSSWFKQHGHKVKVLNYNLWDYDYCEEIKNADAVVFTGFEEFKDAILTDAKIAKEMGKKVWIGGALATFTPEIFSDLADWICQGEIEGLCPINSIPFPDYEAFGIDEYHRRHPQRYMGVLTSRGCPHSCSFCAHTCKYRCRSLKAVEEEIDHYNKAYKLDTLIVNDNTLNVNKGRFMAFCDIMRPKKLAWTAAIRTDIFDDEMADKAKNSGCYYFVVGVESFKQSRLDYMDKKSTSESVYRTLDLLHKHKIGYHGNILTGFETDTFEDIMDEVAAIPYGYNVVPVLLQPFIGTRKEQRRITAEQTSYLNQKFTDFIHSRGLSCYPMA